MLNAMRNESLIRLAQQLNELKLLGHVSEGTALWELYECVRVELKARQLQMVGD